MLLKLFCYQLWYVKYSGLLKPYTILNLKLFVKLKCQVIKDTIFGILLLCGFFPVSCSQWNSLKCSLEASLLAAGSMMWEDCNSIFWFSTAGLFKHEITYSCRAIPFAWQVKSQKLDVYCDYSCLPNQLLLGSELSFSVCPTEENMSLWTAKRWK